MAVDHLPEALEQFINTSDWDDARRVADTRPELLSDEALALLAESIADYRLSERDQVADYLEEHRVVLDRAREVGLDRAFAEANERAQENLARRQEELSRLRPAQTTGMQAAIWELLDADNPETLDRILAEHPEFSQREDAVSYLDELIMEAERNGYDQALKILRDYHELLQAYFELPPVMLALQEFIATPTWEEARDILNAHPELMSTEALEIVDSLIAEADAQNDQPSADALRMYRRVLERSRDAGIEAAWEELMQAPEQAR